ncbi:MAG: ABC transporter permease [Bacteroidia bacterium]|nr:ABC transporter permease [Bacteroidia bacterium]MDW8134562.1 ABC transporter permease [Bacteroidia bacterium]
MLFIVREALKALWEYRIRALLTLSMLAMGITALVGILTTLEALRVFIAKSLVGLGTQTFLVTGGEIVFRFARARLGARQASNLRPWEIDAFEKKFLYPGARLSRHAVLNSSARAFYKGNSTANQVRLYCVEPAYFSIQEISLSEGRLFSEIESRYGLPVILIGASVAKQLFPQTSPLGKWIRVEDAFYQVIGVLKPRGGLFGINLDMECFVPWGILRRFSSDFAGSTYVGVPSVEEVPRAANAARAVMRTIRRIKPGQEEPFAVMWGEQWADFALDQIRVITFATLGISLITLLGATLSLTNILLVVVKERTQEIGLRMAIGATRWDIRKQFLSEAVVVAVVGGMGGIGLGILVGNGVAWLIGASFVMPWKWVGVALLISMIVGILAGYQPAQEAARLQPVDALRYE